MKSIIIVCFTIMIIISGKTPEYYFSKGQEYYDKKEYVKAIDCFSNAIKIKSDYFDAYYKRGICKTKIDSNASAVKDFDKIIELSPNGDAYNERAKVKYYKLNDSLGACEDWNMGCELMNNRACESYRLKCR